MERELSRVVDALPAFVWTALPDGHLDFVNQRWCEYTGLGVNEANGFGWQAAIHPEDQHELFDRWRSVLDSGEPSEIEARLRRFDGEYHWFLFRIGPSAVKSGRVVKWYGLVTDIEDRRNSKEAVRGWWLSSAAREHHFRSIANDVPNLATLMTPAGDVELVNRQVLEYFGATLQKVKGWAISDTVHPDDLPKVLAAWSEAVETGRPYNIESRLRRADGIYRWFHTRGFALRDTAGRVVFWYLLQTDIDDRKRAEALLAGEKRFLEMVAGGHSLPEILEALCRLVESTVSGCYCSVVLVDEGGTRLEHGAAPNLPTSFITSIVGRPVNVDSGPCAMAAHLNEQVIAADLASETRWAAHEWCPMAMAHGLRACWSTPISSTTGKVLGAFAVYYDGPRTPTQLDQSLIEQFKHIASIAIERVQGDAALRRSEAFLAQGQRLSSTGSFLWRVAADEITWSEQIYRIFEFDRGVPITLERIASRVHPDDMPLWFDMVERAQGDGGDFESDHRLQMPDGSIKYLHIIGHETQDKNGPLEYIGAVQDVTQRQLAEEALGDARSELAHVARAMSLEALTASIAHEVNQPLSGVITNAGTSLRMLAADPPNLDGARETVRRIIRDGNRAADVISRLRALFTEKGITAESVDLNEATREVIALSSGDLQRGRVILRPEFASDLPPITGDRVQLQQVILNLLRNAVDSMSGVEDRPRQLVIRTEQDEDDRVRLTVRDAGAGFDPQSANRLFDPFYTTKRSGMGIGLSVSRSIIESHRGRLWAAPNEGPGATFVFSIPRDPEGISGAHSLGTFRTPAGRIQGMS